MNQLSEYHCHLAVDSIVLPGRARSSTHWGWHPLLLSLLFMPLFALLFSGGGSSEAAPEIPKFYYFNPDSTQVNFQNLNREMDTFLHGNGLQVQFQAFARYRDFHEQVREAKPAFLFIPSWYLDQNGVPPGISPLLLPVRQGQKTYTKLLMTSRASGLTSRDLAGKTVAMTTLGGREEAMLDKMLFKRLGIPAKEMKVLHVSKDLDALIGVAINQVELAFVSREAIAKLRELNPRLAEVVISLAESDPIPLPLLCYIPGKTSAGQLAAFKRVFQERGNKPEDRKIMKMLEFDDWKTIDK